MHPCQSAVRSVGLPVSVCLFIELPHRRTARLRKKRFITANGSRTVYLRYEDTQKVNLASVGFDELEDTRTSLYFGKVVKVILYFDFFLL